MLIERNQPSKIRGDEEIDPIQNILIDRYGRVRVLRKYTYTSHRSQWSTPCKLHTSGIWGSSSMPNAVSSFSKLVSCVSYEIQRNGIVMETRTEKSEPWEVLFDDLWDFGRLLEDPELEGELEDWESDLKSDLREVRRLRVFLKCCCRPSWEISLCFIFDLLLSAL